MDNTMMVLTSQEGWDKVKSKKRDDGREHQHCETEREYTGECGVHAISRWPRNRTNNCLQIY